MALPDAFEGERNVVLVAFLRRHQPLVDSWVPWLEDEARRDPGLRFYELPTIARRWAPLRPFIDGGMASAIGDPAVLQRTVTVYGDLGRVTGPLGITDRSTIALFLVEPPGWVRWSGSAGFDPGVASGLARALATSRGVKGGRRPRPGRAAAPRSPR